MKKKTLFSLSFFAILGLAACGGTTPVEPDPTPEDPPTPTEPDDPVTPTFPTTPTYEEESFQIHYLRPDNKYDGWNLWLWAPGADGKQYDFNGGDATNGAIASYKRSEFPNASRIGFIIRKGNWASKDTDGDRFLEFGLYPADEKGVHHIYIKSGDVNIYSTSDYKMLDGFGEVGFRTERRFYASCNNPIKKWSLTKDGEEIAGKSFTADFPKVVIYDLPDGTDISYGSQYRFSVTFAESNATMESDVSLLRVLNTEGFDKMYSYYGDDLGALVQGGNTSFKVWSPFSKSIAVRVYDNGTPRSVDINKGDDTYDEYPMTLGEKGVYSALVNKDLRGKYYTYFVKSNAYPDGIEIVDPYAKGAGVNGLRGLVVDFAQTNPDGWDAMSPHAYDRKELTVYETHVVDPTSSPTWGGPAEKAKTYLGLIEEGTTYTASGKTVKTGFDHIKELGVNAIQLQPIFDQANDETKPEFNWGYNPLNYNVLEGSYSSNPFDGYARIKEFKKLVQAYHEAGVNIIMDVVYNHVNDANSSNFEVLFPGYFYRHDSHGVLTNGSGCGNETASELPMMRKFIKDSTAFWAKEYKLGGFRFDLMGLHDLQTMKETVAELVKINPKIVVYGEPWTGGDSPLATKDRADQANIKNYAGYGAFNDGIRDGLIAGGMAANEDKAWVTDPTYEGDVNSIRSGIAGATYRNALLTSDPDKAVVYASCHDNFTLYDRMVAAKVQDEAVRKKMATLANSIVFTSQGTSFFLGGEEFLRSKGSDLEIAKNSYNASYEVNTFDYSLKVKHFDLFERYQKLIALKTKVDGLHLDAEGAKSFKVNLNELENTFTYDVKDLANNKTYRIAHCNGNEAPGTVNLDGYTLYLDTLDSGVSFTAKTQLQPYQTLIGVKAA